MPRQQPAATPATNPKPKRARNTDGPLHAEDVLRRVRLLRESTAEAVEKARERVYQAQRDAIKKEEALLGRCHTDEVRYLNDLMRAAGLRGEESEAEPKDAPATDDAPPLPAWANDPPKGDKPIAVERK